MRITKAEREALRLELRGKGYPPGDIARVMQARYRIRPRLAWRWAFGLTLGAVACEWNQQDASGRAPMTTQRVSDYERWPDGGKRPTVYVLLRLAKIYGAAVERLLDERDYAALNEKQLFEVIELCADRPGDADRRDASAQTPAQPSMPVETTDPEGRRNLGGSAVQHAASPAQVAPVSPWALEVPCLDWESLTTRLRDSENGVLDETEEARTKRRLVIQVGGLALTRRILDLLDIEPDMMHSALDAGTASEERLVYLEGLADRLGQQVVKVPPVTLLDCAVLHFGTVRRLVNERQKTSYQVRLGRVGAKLGTVVGEILFNGGLFDHAFQWYQVAQHAARDAGDRYLADIALCGQTYLPTYTSDPSGVLALVDPRLQQRFAPTPAIAWLLGFKAKAHAALDERAEFERTIDHARATLERSPSGLVQAGIFSFTPEKLAFYEATGYAKLKDPQRTAEAADLALSLYDLTDTTEPALVRLDKAFALAQTGEICEACRLAEDALVDPATYHSVSLMVRAQEFDRLINGHRLRAIREWKETLSAIKWPQPTALSLPIGMQRELIC